MKTIKGSGMGLLVGLLWLNAFAGDQKVIEIKSVQKILATQHASWKAKESWVSKLSRSEITHMLGVKERPRGSLDFQPLRTMGSDSIDWRNNNGANWLGPVMNQGNCGSCVAFATIATYEAQTSISSGVNWLHPTFSPQELFACGGGSCESGWLPDSASNYLTQFGVPDEACMPYTSGSTGDDAACSQKCGDSDSRSIKISSYTTPSSYGGSVQSVTDALKQGPLITTLSVYADFVTYGSGVYKHTTGNFLGGHAVSLVGYDSTKRAWLIRNSWGTEWGENGFAWVSWDDESGVGANTWHLEVAAGNTQLTVSTPTDREYVSGQYQLTAQSQGLKANDVQFHLKDSEGKDVKTVSCSTLKGDGCSAMIDTIQLKEGRYEIYASSTSSASAKSQVREFFIINSEPKQNISFSAASGTDLTKPLSGRPEFEITVDSSPVPTQYVEFRAIDKDGKIAAVKSNSDVLKQMKMGWRTMTVPDGDYQILFHGETRYNGKVYAVDSPSVTVTVKN